jgi:hypothetical protein
MNRAALRGTFYLVLAVAVFALIGGFTLGSFTFGSFGYIPRQSSASGNAPGSPAGLSFPLAEAQLVSVSTAPAAGNCTATNLGTNASPIHLSNGNYTGICMTAVPAGGYAPGDTMWVLEVSWNASGTPLTSFQLRVTVDVTPATNDVAVVAYVETSATITTFETAVLAVDLTQAGDSSVGSFSILATQL